MNDLPKRCVDPVMKYCQECPYGNVTYGDDVETSADIEGSFFETHCMLGYDKGRPEDEPTDEELKEFEEWSRRLRNDRRKRNKNFKTGTQQIRCKKI